MRAGAAALKLESAESLTGLRLGVEQGSIYESWVNTFLVKTDIIPPAKRDICSLQSIVQSTTWWKTALTWW